MAYYFEPFTFPIPSVPVSDATTDLGSSSLRFRDLYLSRALIIGTNPSSAGAIRLANNAIIQWRNQANSADIQGITLDTNNAINIQAGLALIDASGNLSLGSNPASAGAIRLANAANIESRNAANTANLFLIRGESDDTVFIDANGNGSKFGNGVTNFTLAATALGGGAGAALGTIGGAGPAAAAQNAWFRIQVLGVNSYIPFWR